MRPKVVAVYIQKPTVILKVMKFINVILFTIKDFKFCMHSLKKALSY